MAVVFALIAVRPMRCLMSFPDNLQLRSAEVRRLQLPEVLRVLPPCCRSHTQSIKHVKQISEMFNKTTEVFIGAYIFLPRSGGR